MLQVINKKITFVIGASHTIGKYIVPNFLEEIKEAIDNDVSIKVGTTKEVMSGLLEKKVDMALVEETDFNNSITFREWLDDDLILFSKFPLPASIGKDQLNNYKWISRTTDSYVHQAVIEKFEQSGIDYSNFEVVSFVSSSTAIKQSILKSKKPQADEKQMIAFISKHAIKDEIDSQELYMSKIRGMKFNQKLYMAYLKEFKHDAFLKRVSEYIMAKKKI